MMQVLAADGTVKFIFPVDNGRAFEAAYFFIPGRERPHIACVSTQIGCAVRCGFCATRKDGLVRQLTSEEISRQVDAIASLALRNGASERELEVSFMGMGEPLANRKAVIEATNYIHAKYPRMTRVSISTVGPSRAIVVFAREVQHVRIPVHLQVSLHATTDDTRRKLIPSVRDTIEDLLEAGKEYSVRTGDFVCLNYILLHEINDTDEDIAWLSKIDRRHFYVKLTHLNQISGLSGLFVPAQEQRFRQFAHALAASGVSYKIFKGDGLDVQASCGQLASRPIQIQTNFTMNAGG